MSQAEARSWWADVEHLREPLEQRRASRIAAAASHADGVAARRTIKIRGQAVPGAPARALHAVPDAPEERFRDALPAEPARPHPQRRRRPRRRPHELVGPRPDRIAGWAVALVLLVAVVAAISAHA